MAAKKDTKDKPWTSNYPPLETWLRNMDARCNYQLPLGGEPEEPNAYVESWSLPNGRDFLIVVQGGRRGWDVYTAPDTNDAANTLADATIRLTRVAPVKS